MAVRTTASAVAEIIEVDTSISLTPFIETANQLVTDVCSDSDYTAAKLELIERWLSAHFYAIRDARVDTEKAGSVSVKYQYKIDLNLKSTHWGQQAMLLDYEGNLAALNKRMETGQKKTATVTWAGTDYDTETEE